jgi:hypothetical protein
MGERSDQIERQIEEKRCELGENFNELEEKVKTAIDWRAQFQERPGTLLALAFGGGVILSALFPPLRSHSSRQSIRSPYTPLQQQVAPERESSVSNAGSHFRSSTTSAQKRSSQTRDSLEAFSGALVSVAVSRASHFLDKLLPGFQQEFVRARATKVPDPSYSSASAESHWPKSSVAGAD